MDPLGPGHVRGLVARNRHGLLRLGGSPRDQRSADKMDRVDKFNWAWRISGSGKLRCAESKNWLSPAWRWCCTIGNYIGQRKRNDYVRSSAPILRLFGSQNPIEVRAQLGRAEL